MPYPFFIMSSLHILYPSMPKTSSNTCLIMGNESERIVHLPQSSIFAERAFSPLSRQMSDANDVSNAIPLDLNMRVNSVPEPVAVPNSLRNSTTGARIPTAHTARAEQISALSTWAYSSFMRFNTISRIIPVSAKPIIL